MFGKKSRVIKCKYCGETDVNKLCKDKRCLEGRANICVKCFGRLYTNLRATRRSKQYTQKRRSYNREYMKMYRDKHKHEPEYKLYRSNVNKRHRFSSNDKLNHHISSAIYFSLNGNKAGRHWEDVVGYTLDDLKCRLEAHFKEGMTWDNYGEWHIDHRIPLSWWKEDCVLDAWSLWNLQPMWGKDNMKKHNFYKSPIVINTSEYSKRKFEIGEVE